MVLFEKAAETGGQINLPAKTTWRQSLSGIARWLDGQARKLGVELRLGSNNGVIQFFSVFFCVFQYFKFRPWPRGWSRVGELRNKPTRAGAPDPKGFTQSTDFAFGI